MTQVNNLKVKSILQSIPKAAERNDAYKKSPLQVFFCRIGNPCKVLYDIKLILNYQSTQTRLESIWIQVFHKQ